MSKFTAKAANVINRSMYLACELGHTYIGSEHMLLAILSEADCVAARLLERRGVEFDDVKSAVIAKVGSGERSNISAADITPRTKRIIEASAYHADKYSQQYIGTEHLLLALVNEPDSVAVSVLGTVGVSAADIGSDIVDFFEEISGDGGERTIQKPLLKRDAPMLYKYGRDLTTLARSGKIDPIIGRDTETERVIQILSRRTKNNPCLIGEPGVGKTAVVEGLARLICDDRVPETLSGKTIVTLDIASMIAGAKYRGEFEERMKAVMAEVSKNPHIILFIDEIHTLIGAGAAEGAVDAANILKPALARGELQLIGATTTEEYRKYIEKDSALERRFGAVMVGEPTPEESIAILKGLRRRYEAHHKVTITDEAIDAAVNMSVRYIGDKHLPDKAIDLIDEAASRARISGFGQPVEIRDAEAEIKHVRGEKEEAIRSQDFELAARLRDSEASLRAKRDELTEKWKSDREKRVISIGADDIAEIVTASTGIPVKKLEGEETERLMKLEEIIKSKVIGQDRAASAVASAIRRGRVGLKDPKRPIGSFIFAGPTGVGKTQMCLVLAETLFGDSDAIIRVDMSEFLEKHSASKLIGSPPGYVGYGDGGQLTEKIRRKPYSVVLFDEIEKAHPDVFNVLLQILEDGVLTDSAGRRVDFKNAVIIMTSNIGAERLIDRRSALGFAPSAEREGESPVMESLREAFRPEFINRIDEIVVFNKLSRADIEAIAAAMTEDVRRRASALGVELTVSPEAISLIAERGYDEKYGARPLRRAVQSMIEDRLADEMLNGEIGEGDKLYADVSEGEIVYRPFKDPT